MVMLITGSSRRLDYRPQIQDQEVVDGCPSVAIALTQPQGMCGLEVGAFLRGERFVSVLELAVVKGEPVTYVGRVERRSRTENRVTSVVPWQMGLYTSRRQNPRTYG